KAAAFLLAHIAVDLEEQEAWLAKSDTSSAYVQDMQLEVQAEKQLRDGHYDEADKSFAKVAAFRESTAKHDAIAANNAATAHGRRFEATGDIGHLRDAARLLEGAARIVPDNAILLGNTSAVFWHIGLLTVLDKWLQTKALVI